MSLDTPVPYCGPAPVPGQLTWNADPLLAVCLLIIAALYAWRGRRLPGSRQLVFWCGWIVLTLALISPLCNLSVALFSARIAQHVVLTTIAAPLLVLGDAGRIFRGKLGPMNVRGRTHATHQAVAVVVFALILWLWHLPSFYDATFRGTIAYWTMHITMVGAALLFWDVILRGSTSFAATLAAVFATMLQMSLLGAVLTFAGQPLFPVHAGTTWAFGLSPLADQQLGGLIMWVIGGVLMSLYALKVLSAHVVAPEMDAVAVPEPVVTPSETFGGRPLSEPSI
jgi:putative membrane protein